MNRAPAKHSKVVWIVPLAALTAAGIATALVATMLSMAAAVGGSLVGRGTAFRLFPSVVIRRDTPPRVVVPTA